MWKNFHKHQNPLVRISNPDAQIERDFNPNKNPCIGVRINDRILGDICLDCKSFLHLGFGIANPDQQQYISLVRI